MSESKNTATKSQTHCFSCGERFMVPSETRGRGTRVCEECLDAECEREGGER